MEERKEVAIPCIHQPWEWRTAKRVISFGLQYFQIERQIDCHRKYTESEYRASERWSSLFHGKQMKQVNCNPLDCEDCKVDIKDYLTDIISHPNPDAGLSDICRQLHLYLSQANPSPREVASYTKWRKTVASLVMLAQGHNRANNGLNATVLVNFGPDKDSTSIERITYRILNNIEEHRLPQGKEWRVTWVGNGDPRLHPRLCELNLDKVDQPSPDFTCPICLQGHAKPEIGQGKKKKRRENSCPDNNVVSLPCKHVYHESCISLWIQDARRNSCPLCRHQLPDVPTCAASSYQRSSRTSYMDVVSYQP